MKIGLVGLGRMGAGIAKRLRRDGHLEAVERIVPTPAIAAALFARFNSRDDNSFAMRLIAALRSEFGGHEVRAS